MNDSCFADSDSDTLEKNDEEKEKFDFLESIIVSDKIQIRDSKSSLWYKIDLQKILPQKV